jgi:hypothetical protein
MSLDILTSLMSVEHVDFSEKSSYKDYEPSFASTDQIETLLAFG